MRSRFKSFLHCCLVSMAILFFVGVFRSPEGHCLDADNIKILIKKLKTDPRGPYEAIRWFCPDGQVLPANQRCAQPGGIQHAVAKERVQKLAREEGIFLGQILAGTDFEAFLDSRRQYSRLKQYQIEKYIKAVDDGWIFRRGRFYRGAVQHENESRWGKNFLKFCLSDPALVDTQYYLLRQAAGDIPHLGEDNLWMFIRTQSKMIADQMPAFNDLRVKLHGQPEPADLERVKRFLSTRKSELSEPIQTMFAGLIQAIEKAYQAYQVRNLRVYLSRLPAAAESRRLLEQLVAGDESEKIDAQSRPQVQCSQLAELLWQLRKEFGKQTQASTRLHMLDLSAAVGNILFQKTAAWQPRTLGELIDKTVILADGCAGIGVLEMWEWEQIRPIFLRVSQMQDLDVATLETAAEYARRTVEWGSGMVKAAYAPAVSLFSQFEPLAEGFIDDRIRACLLLPLGAAAGQLRAVVTEMTGLSHRILNLDQVSRVHGLNPGFALGTLEVMDGLPENVSFSDRKIYVMHQAPPDLKPVAGIATVTAGNLVSHVQLLARNLGIPNAVVSEQNLKDLKTFSGQAVFYAVSPGGRVIMKPAADMSAEERSLVEKKQRSEERMRVPTDRIDLDLAEPIDLSEIDATHSGRRCGPKAANLGQLKRMFPEHVVNGVVIPFGGFRRHMDQPMPGAGMTYWQFLQQIFDRAAAEIREGRPETDVERTLLERLHQLRKAIAEMKFLPAFQKEMKERFETVLGSPLGQLPVFVRSDTNMEDLKEFTGAGLNLTVFNVVEEAQIWQAIRDVWASPYTERSYRWRQKFLLNPEEVYPSILILPTVNVDKSGVMITTGVSGGAVDDMTVAFSRGAGGAVEGQMAETYRMAADGRVRLLSPARESRYHLLPATGGVSGGFTSFEKRLLSPKEIEQLRQLAEIIKTRLPGTPGIESRGPYDVELGFLGANIWLFQIRPYVENKRAKSSAYLSGLDPERPKNVSVSPQRKLN